LHSALPLNPPVILSNDVLPFVERQKAISASVTFTRYVLL